MNPNQIPDISFIEDFQNVQNLKPEFPDSNSILLMNNELNVSTNKRNTGPNNNQLITYYLPVSQISKIK